MDVEIASNAHRETCTITLAAPAPAPQHTTTCKLAWVGTDIYSGTLPQTLDGVRWGGGGTRLSLRLRDRDAVFVDGTFEVDTVLDDCRDYPRVHIPISRPRSP